MSRWRIITVAILIVGPFAVLALLGSYYLWLNGWTYRVWWPLSLCIIAGYILGWHWQRRQKLLKPTDFERPLHWTERDGQAWKIVEARARAAADVDPDRLTELQFYVDTAHDLALELARFYHPGVQDPFAALTIPEMLAVVELASKDLAELADQYLPGGHLLTVNNLRQARQATQLYQSLNKLYWMVSAVFSPVNTALRYTASQLGMSMPWQQFQQDIVLWFYTVYVHRLGTYLIDLNSGRLRVGARRYRELVQAQKPSQLRAQPAGEVRPLDDPANAVRRLTLLVLGQVKAGKSSFINALLGEQRAKTDVLPATAEVQRYELQPAGIPTRLVLLDTVGYGHAGPREDQLRFTEEEARHADLLILVMHVHNPARQADLDMLQKLRAWFAAHPELRMPPVLGVLTHIDLLSPSLEWAPPYNWQEPVRPKERSIRNAWSSVRELLGDRLAGLVPVCTAEGKVYGIEEWFLPALTELLDEAHAVALLRCLRAEADTGRVRKVFLQLLAAGEQAALAVSEKHRPADGRPASASGRNTPAAGSEHSFRRSEIDIMGDPDTPSRVRYGVLALLCGLSFVLYLDRMCIGQAAPAIRAELDLTPAQMGFVFAAFSVAYGMFEVVTGHWGDRYGCRRVLARIVLWWSAFTALTGLATGFTFLLVVRFLFGAGEAGAYPNAARVTESWFAPASRGAIRGAINMPALVGGMVAPPATALLMTVVGWRGVFLLYGLLGVVWTGLFLWWYRDRPEDHWRVNAAEREAIGPPPAPAAHPAIPWGPLVLNRNVWLLGTVVSAGAATVYTLFSWYPSFLIEVRGIAVESAGWLSGLVMLGGALGCLAGGWASDWAARALHGSRWARSSVGTCAFALAALAMAAGSMCADAVAMSVWFSVACFCIHTHAGAYWGATADIGGRNVAALFAVVNSIGAIGGGSAQVLFGYVDRTHWTTAFGGCALLLALGAVCWSLDARRPMRAADLPD